MPRPEQQRALLVAARGVFDERGVDDTQIEDIARAAGISKGLVYRYFGSKAELKISAVLIYLDEVDGLVSEVPAREDPIEELMAAVEVFMRYGIAHPAFLDCALSLVRVPALELLETAPNHALRLVGAMARGMERFVRLVERAAEQGLADVEDPDLWANYWYARALGSLHLARSGVIIQTGTGDTPAVRAISADELVRTGLEDLLADIGVRDARARARAHCS